MNISLICVPYQLDVARWAYALGPQSFLDHGLESVCRKFGHKIQNTTWVDLPRAERTRDIVTNLARIAKRTSLAVADALRDPNGLAIVLEGDCSHAVGVAGGIARAGMTPGIAWFDAHGDLHTYATTTTGYVGGMPFAVALGWDCADWQTEAGLTQPVRAEAAALIGTSDLDPEEVTALEKHPIARLDAANFGNDPAKQVSDLLAPRNKNSACWYLHLDVDVAGPQEVPGGMTPSLKSPTRDALRSAIRSAARTLKPRALSLATYNPTSDPDGRGARFGLDMLEAMLDGIQDSTKSAPLSAKVDLKPTQPV
jgi:arginase